MIGVGAAAIAAPLLLVLSLRWHGVSQITLASLIYALSLLATLGFSAAYHTSEDARLRSWLRRGDHAAIFGKIAGTFTPIIVLHGDAATLSLLAILWIAALSGMVLKLFQPPDWDRAAVALYLVLAWGTLAYALPIMTGLNPASFRLAVGGGLIYTAGVVFHLWDGLPFQNAIWHGFVLVGTALCFLAILVEIGVAGTV